MKVIYVAGKYRDKPLNNIYENIEHARRMARELWMKNWAVICPHTNTAWMDDLGETDQLFLDGDLEILKRCDAIMMLSNWQNSVGAIGEWQLATAIGLEIYYEEEGIPDCLE